MRATVNGVTIEGTPEEIAALLGLRCDDLERRVRDLEARPVIPTIWIQPAPPALPVPNPWPPLGPPWGPFYIGDPVPNPFAPSVYPLTQGAHDQTVQPFGALGTFICAYN